MDYMGWVLSIYDECIKRYNKRYLKKLTNKEVIRKVFNKEYLVETISLIMTIFYIVGLITLMVLYFLGIIKRIEVYLTVGGLVLLISYIPQIYRYELKLEYFKRKLIILSEILEEESLTTTESIEKLVKDTEGVLDKIKSFDFQLANKFVLTLSGLSAAIGIKNINIENQTIKNFILILFIVLIFIIFMAWITYLILTMIPNSRIVRRQKLHELLKILLIYKKANNQDNENINIVKDI